MTEVLSYQKVLIWFTLWGNVSSFIFGDINIPDHFNWRDEGIASTFLVCPDCCRNELQDSCISHRFISKAVTACCVDKSKPFWMFNPYNHYIEFLKIEADILVNKTVTNDNNPTRLNMIHSNEGSISSFPHNICQYPNIVEIHLTNQKIREIPEVGCLKVVDTLDLSGNQIKMIKSSTFTQMSYLRNLRLSYNQISCLEPGTFQYPNRSLAYIFIDHNQLFIIDISNCVIGYHFEYIDYEYNRISSFTNDLHWDGFSEDNVGSGSISVANNNFSRLPNFQLIGIRNFNSVLRGVFNYMIFLYGNPWYCDCELFIFFKNFIDAVPNFDLDVTCNQPMQLKGITPKHVYNNKKLLDLFICNITMKEKCPPLCYCFYQPSLDRIMVNCSKGDRTKMSKLVPDMNSLHIDFSYNAITSVENRSYLNRTVELDLSHNRIAHVNSFLFSYQSLKFLNLEHNFILTFGRSVQLKTACQLQLGKIALGNCLCEMQWIKVWLLRKTCSNFKNNISCIRSGKDVNIKSISTEQLCPAKEQHFTGIWTTVIVVVSVLVVITAIYVNFRYELKLILRTWGKPNGVPKQHEKYEFDGYLSFDVENDDVRAWTVNVLDTLLKHNRYKVCIPYRDFLPGGVQVEQIYSYATKSKVFIIVLSRSYFVSQLQMIELNHIWDIFISNESTKLVIVNFDLLDSKYITEKKVKALIRTGHSIEFCNYDKQLFNMIKSKMATPNNF